MSVKKIYECQNWYFLLDIKLFEQLKDARKDQTQVSVLCFDVQEIEFVHILWLIISRLLCFPEYTSVCCIYRKKHQADADRKKESATKEHLWIWRC